MQDYKNVQRWADTVLAQPAVKRGRMVNRMSGDPSEQLRERHDASDFGKKYLRRNRRVIRDVRVRARFDRRRRLRAECRR